MTALHPNDFDGFFEALWGYTPFPWQRRLAQEVCEQGWPKYIDLPTASGKTACLDVAVFALASQAPRKPEDRTAGRRIFFAVNRRVIVDEAHERAVEIARKLQERDGPPILQEVAHALREISGDPDAPPLDVALMRGGIVRDNRWARSITQPTIITSTIDQLGSRLLFRGYGVSDEAKPLHAALIAHDSLLLLDEAHISQPFVETLNAVKRYRGHEWAEKSVHTAFDFVQMTATPPEEDSERFRLETPDWEDPTLGRRLDRAKNVTLETVSKAKGNGLRPLEELAGKCAEQAMEFLDPAKGRRNIAIVVNRVATARMAAQHLTEKLQKEGVEGDVYLAIGSMRPIDRDALTKDVQARVGPAPDPELAARPMFVVATQCLEVGADFDFDAMVSECASLDALRQRFGRLNRRGRDIEARGAIIIRGDQVNEENDPVYGSALAKTWEWLNSIGAGKPPGVDFSVTGMKTLLEGVDISGLLTPRENAPVMFPAYLDAWAQTHPMPAPDPDVALFLHGPGRGEPEVQVCWRSDLVTGNEHHWLDIVSLCPPSSPECMSVPISSARRWLSNPDQEDADRSDLLEGTAPAPDGEEQRKVRPAVLWRGRDGKRLLDAPADLRPGDTLVLPVGYAGWEALGHKPKDAPEDIAEQAYRQSRGRTILRLWSGRLSEFPGTEAVAVFREWLSDPEVNLRVDDIRSLLREIAEAAPDGEAALAGAMRDLGEGKYGFQLERYPDGRGAVMRTTRPLGPEPFIPAMDDGDDRPLQAGEDRRVSLADHLEHVVHLLDGTLRHLPLNDAKEALRCAARLHDWGKADERFQAFLINGDLNDAWAQPELWAKSGSLPTPYWLLQHAYGRSGLPEGFRHEMLSMQLAERTPDRLPPDPADRDLTLHLVAAHHGRARPFAPVIPDEDPPEVGLEPLGVDARLTAEQRTLLPPHRLDSGIAERFWILTRRFGWWGLAYLEAVVRLADQRASQREAEGRGNNARAQHELAEKQP